MTEEVMAENLLETPQSPAKPQYWSEVIRDKPRTDNFPVVAFLIGILPGIIALGLLLIPLLLLRQQASRQIVYLDGEGRVHAVQANTEEIQTISELPFQLDAVAESRLKENLPVLGLPSWSSNNSKVATVVSTGNNLGAVVFDLDSGRMTTLSSIVNSSNIVAIFSNSWSPNGERLALLETDGQQISLSLLDMSQPDPVMIPIDGVLDRRTGVDWHPSGERLIVTISDGSIFPALQTVSTDGTVEAFSPNDRGAIRADAIWSPGGESVVYTVVNTNNFLETERLMGAIWMADEDGNNPRPIVSEGLNFAPIWDEADPTNIYFSRFISTTNAVQLYRINTIDFSEAEFVGSSNFNLVDYPFERDRFLNWTDTPIPLAIYRELEGINQNYLPQGEVVRTIIQRNLPTTGWPAWSPDGSFLVVNNWQQNKILPAVYDSNLREVDTPESTNNIMVVPADGWSADSTAVTLIENDGLRSLLTLIPADFNVQNSRVFNFSLDERAGIDWHPLETELLVTGYDDGSSLPNLYRVNFESDQPRLISPDDGLEWHADAVWSPDGSQIAYVAGDIYTSTQDILAGELRVAAADGNGSRPLGSHRQVIAPVYSPSGDFIYYTRYSGPSERFSLYRIATDNATPPEYIGPSSEYILDYAWDRSALLQWSPDGRQLLFVGEHPVAPSHYISQQPSLNEAGLVETDLPLLGAGYWAPDGQQYAGTIVTDQGVQVVTFKSPTGPPIQTPTSSDQFVVPADGWSLDSDFVAMLRYDGNETHLTLMDTTQTRLATSLFTVDTRAGISWHPTNSQLLVTSLENGITPTIRIFNALNNSSTIFSPEDDQLVRADGVWSPDGGGVAYIAHETLTPTMALPFLAGPLWIATADGQNAVELVPEGLNFAPIWDMQQSRILFTRYLSETDRFDLYQVDFLGEMVERIGPSSEAFAQFPFDRQYFRRWSPEGHLWLLPGAERVLPFVYYQFDNSGTVSRLESGCQTSLPYAVRWVPTNRGILVACPTENMYLRWLDSNRDNKDYPDGLFPVWQP